MLFTNPIRTLLLQLKGISASASPAKLIVNYSPGISHNLGNTRGFRTSVQLKLERAPSSTSSSPSDSSSISIQSVFSKSRKLFGHSDSASMGYFVIGVSGVTCGGKTSLTKLLQRTLPWARVIHQDHYFRDDDWPHHIRSPEAENHVNYEVFQALDMDTMYKDVKKILEDPPVLMSHVAAEAAPSENLSNGALLGDKAATPNFEGGDRFLQQITDIDVDVSKYSKVPILIIEGFTIFGSQFLFDQCQARFFCTLDKETCRVRRSARNYVPPDTPSYFEKIIWPEYEKHFSDFVDKRTGMVVFDGNTSMEDIWKTSIQIVTCRMEEKRQEEKFSHAPKDFIV